MRGEKTAVRTNFKCLRRYLVKGKYSEPDYGIGEASTIHLELRKI